MEPSLIYAASNKLKGKVKWVGIYAETEWIYFGAESDVNEDFAILEILDYFHKRPVVIAIDRKKSAIVQSNEVRKFLRGILGFKNFLIWDQSFSSVIEFSHVGVMRKGYV